MKKNLLVDSRDVEFVLFELLKIDSINQYQQYAAFDKELFINVINLFKGIAEDQFYPVNKEGDRKSAKYDPIKKEVKVPDCYKSVYEATVRTGILGLHVKSEYAGLGMPFAVGIACKEYLSAANASLAMYMELTNASANLIRNYGTEEQKLLFLQKMMTGQWSGTMCITEPEAGSDVGSIMTKAVRKEDGTYRITGNKIFITGGDNDLVENIIHPVLARIENDPQGTKGLTLFLVPKYLVNPDGSLGKKNDIICSGIEEKMGMKGSATCSLSFGDHGNCVGYLLGKEQQGMKIMFQMMNESRISVGLQALALTSTAYMHALNYAKERVQGPHYAQVMNPDAKMTPIINHPDVKRMLFRIKSYVEGMRMLTYYLAYQIDQSEIVESDQKKSIMGIIDLLTPIIKAGNSDIAWILISECIQIYGGYGYCRDYPIEQFARDAKIGSIYEGSNGIQSIDFVIRKILMNPNQFNLSVFREAILNTINKAHGFVEENYILPIQKGLDQLVAVVEHIKVQLSKGNFLNILGITAMMQQAMFIFTLGWLHLWSLSLTMQKVRVCIGSKSDQERNDLLENDIEAKFYYNKVLSSKYFIDLEFPVYFSIIDRILKADSDYLKYDTL